MSVFHIGNVRRRLMFGGSHKWNAWVRDFTAVCERRMPWLIGMRGKK